MEAMGGVFLRMAAALVVLAAVHSPLLAQVDGAEYALRWKAGGPATAEEAVRVLKLAGPQKRTVFQVEYFDIGNPPLPGKAPIARKRTSDGKVELTLKYRADAVPAAFDPETACPLGKKVQVKRETDISVDAGMTPHPVTSISCERQAKKAINFPEPLRAASRGCANTMVRIAVDGFKVEEWQFPRGRVIEVSMAGGNTTKDMERFTKVVRRLPLDKLETEDRSKSEAGSSCG